MNKVICDVCGTSYPDTATQCPICGCVRTADTMAVSDDSADTAVRTSNYTYVKGGRFSKANVRKRTAAAATGARTQAPRRPASQSSGASRSGSSARKPAKKKSQKSNKGLVIAVIALAAAIVLVVLYILIRFILIPPKEEAKDTLVYSGVVEDEAPPTAEIPCEKATFDEDSLTLTEEGEKRELKLLLNPINTTDAVEAPTIDNNEIASISWDEENLLVVVTAKMPGETLVKLKVGKIEVSCPIYVEYAVEEEKNTTLDIEPNIVLDKEGQTKDIYLSGVDREKVIWSTNNDKVATVEGGVVTAEGAGQAVISAKYIVDGEAYSVTCDVFCDFASSSNNQTGNTDNSGSNNSGSDNTNTGTDSGNNSSNTGSGDRGMSEA